MEGGHKDKGKGVDSAPKNFKKKKRNCVISRRLTGIDIISNSTPSIPPQDTMIHHYSLHTESNSKVPSQGHTSSSYMHPALEYTQRPLSHL